MCMGSALGCMCMSVNGTQCYVEHIGVDGQFRGKGIGKALLTRVDEEARSLGCKVRISFSSLLRLQRFTMKYIYFSKSLICFASDW